MRQRPNVRERTIQRYNSRQAKAAPPASGEWRERTALVLVLVIGTVLLYLPVHSHSFIYFDDNVYILDNSRVNSGLTWDTLWWSVTSTEHANWHPITWVSHAVDCDIFGLNPGAQHLMNVIIHAGSAALLFW